MEIIKRGDYLFKASNITKNNIRVLQHAFTYINPKTEQVRVAITNKNGIISIPRSILKIKKIFPNFKIIDETSFPKIESPFSLKDTFKLRPNQLTAINEVLKDLKKREDTSVILKAPPGFGKSYTLPYLVNKLQTNTLIIVDRGGLAEQMRGEFQENCEELDYVVIGGKERTTKSITIATFQFLIRNEEFIQANKDFFGFVCVDECHTIGSEVFTKVVGKFNARYRLGLSATPTRSDFMTELLLDVMGTKIVDGKSDDNLDVTLVSVGHPVSKFFRDFSAYRKEYAEFLVRPTVFEDILKILVPFKKIGRFGLIYITEVNAQEYYQKVLTEKGIITKVINQRTSPAERATILRQLENEEIDIIVSGSILQKGISIKRLDYIINLSNLTKEAHEQLIGRLRRHHPSKPAPLFLDFHFQGNLLWKGLERGNLSKALVKRGSDKYVTIKYAGFLEKLKSQAKI